MQIKREQKFHDIALDPLVHVVKVTSDRDKKTANRQSYLIQNRNVSNLKGNIAKKISHHVIIPI